MHSSIASSCIILAFVALLNPASGLNWLSTASSAAKKQRVAVTGANGLIGGSLRRSLQSRGVEVITIGRGTDADLRWDPFTDSFPDFARLDGIDAVVHLAGENVGSGEGPLSILGRWSPSKKQAILESRVKSTRLLVDSFARLKSKPKVFICASAAGYYGFNNDPVSKDESSPAGEGFLAYVCEQWEREAVRAEKYAGTRVVLPRFAVVLSTLGGVVAKLLPLFSVGGGGNLGSGAQGFSWVSIDDAVRAIEFLLEAGRISGPVNVCSPNPVDNAAFTTAMGRALSRPTFVPLPEPVAKTLFGQMGRELLLGGQKVVPTKLEKAGFKFRDADIDAAVAKVIKDKI